MTDCCRTSQRRVEEFQRQSKSKMIRDLMKVINQKEVIISQQASTIKELQLKLRNLNEKAKQMRENKLFNLFKDKYERQCELRVEFQRQVFQNMSIIADKLRTIQTSIVKQLSESVNRMEFEESLKLKAGPSLSENISEIMPLRGTKDKTIDVGQLTKHDILQFLEEVMNKMDFVQTVIQVLVVKCEKYSLENRNIKPLIAAGKKQIERKLSDCQKQLKIQIQEKSQLEKTLFMFQNERQKWIEAYSSIGKQDHKKKLLSFAKEELVEEIVKVMLTLNKIKKQKDQQEKQLQTFRKEEKQRYESFLMKLKVKSS